MQNGTESTVVESDVNQIDFGNHPHTIDFDAAFDLYYASNQKSWAHDRSQTVGASEVWNCLKQVWFEKRHQEFGIVPDEKDQNWGAMERGNIIENHFVVPGLRLALPKLGTLPEGVEFVMSGGEQETLILGKNSATPDGLIKGLKRGPLIIRGGGQEVHIEDIQSDCIILEIKSIDPRATLLEERGKHHGQTQVQLGLIREMTDYKPVYSVVLYVDASFINKVTPFVVEFDEAQYAVAKQRALDVYRINDPLQIMPEGRFVGACTTCRWRGPCGMGIIASIPQKKKGTPEAIGGTEPLIRDYLAVKKAYDELEVKLEVAKDAIKDALLHFQSSTLEGADWKATWFTVSGRKTPDMKKIEAALGDLGPYMKEGNPHDQLRITERLPETAEVKVRKRKTKETT